MLKTDLYTGVGDWLHKLKTADNKIAILINKLQGGMDELYRHYFQDTVQVAVGERAGVRRKPAPDMVEIALQAAESAKTFQLEPKVALLSYSTHGSGSGTDVDTVREAAQRLQRMPLDYDVDGELQVDCALSRRVAELKAVDSTVGGNANVLIFPDLNAGNIGYKLVANLGGFEALGPILQGVRLPMNDLSRSATTEEIYKMAIITAMQKEAGNKMRRHGNADSIDLGI